VYCEKCLYSSAEGAYIGWGLRRECPSSHWGLGLERGCAPSPEIFLDFWYQNGGWSFVHSEWYYLPFRCLFYAQKWCFWSSKTNTFDLCTSISSYVTASSASGYVSKILWTTSKIKCNQIWATGG